MRARGSSLLLVASLLVAASSCGDEPSLDHVSTASTILVADGALWLTSPDDDAVVSLDLDTLDELARLSIEGAPERILRASDGKLWVSLALASAVATIDAASLGCGKPGRDCQSYTSCEAMSAMKPGTSAMCSAS